MSYKKLLKQIDLKQTRMGIANNNDNKKDFLYSKSANFLPMVYQGPVDRFEKYTIFDTMEQDTIINQGLDIIADYVTQNENEDAFFIDYSSFETLSDNHKTAIEKSFDDWMQLNSLKKRIHSIMRDVFKYGDCILIRDPETFILNKVNIYDVMGVLVDNDKTPTEYIIKNVDLNVPLELASDGKNNLKSLQGLNVYNSAMMPNSKTSVQQVNNASMTGYSENDMIPVSAENVVQLTLNIDDNEIYPFGRSVLENVYKVYIQKSLIQDCILMYRIKNAVEKTVFKIPMGGIPAYMQRQYLERMKNELHQRRIPSKESKSPFTTMDIAYNSIPMNEDFWLPIDDQGRGPTIEKLTGGQSLGEITDLVLWNNELLRGMKIPSSWIPFGATDGNRTSPVNSREIYVQEQRFLLYCIRLQNMVEESFDREFKFYLKEKGVSVDEKDFRIKFYKPANITEITRQEIDEKRLQNYNSALQNPFIAKQFAIKRYLGWTDEEFKENERLLKIENIDKLKSKNINIPTEDESAIPGLRSLGITDIDDSYIEELQAQSSPETNNEMGGDMYSGEPMNNEMGGNEPSGNEMGNMGGI